MRRFLVAAVSLLVAVFASACAPAQASADPESVVREFYDSLNERDIDMAMELVAEEAKFVTGSAFVGQTAIREATQKRIDRNTSYEVDSVQVEGDTVTWTLRATGEFSMCEQEMRAEVRNGRIEYMEGHCM